MISHETLTIIPVGKSRCEIERSGIFRKRNDRRDYLLERGGISSIIRRLGPDLSLCKQMIKDAITDRIGHFFGMELHTDNATIWRFNALYDSVFTAGTYNEFSANRLESLQVKAIGRPFGLAQNGREMGIGSKRDRVVNGIFCALG